MFVLQHRLFGHLPSLIGHFIFILFSQSVWVNVYRFQLLLILWLCGVVIGFFYYHFIIVGLIIFQAPGRNEPEFSAALSILLLLLAQSYGLPWFVSFLLNPNIANSVCLRRSFKSTALVKFCPSHTNRLRAKIIWVTATHMEHSQKLNICRFFKFVIFYLARWMFGFGNLDLISHCGLLILYQPAIRF